MQRDPSDQEGLRTSLESDANDERSARFAGPAAGSAAGGGGTPAPLVTRAGVSGLLAVFAVVIGFGIGSRIGFAESSPHDLPQQLSQESPHQATNEAAATALAEASGEAQLAAHNLPSVSSAPTNVLAAVSPPGVPIIDLPIYRESPPSGSNGATGPSNLSNPGSIGSAQRADPADSLTIVTKGEIGKGESLGGSLRRQGISPSTVHLIAKEMRKVFDFRHSRPGDSYRLGQDADGRVLDFRYQQSPEESFYLAWEGTRYVVKKETAELRPLIAKIAGIVDSSFYGAILGLGEQSALASEFARILAWDIDFSRQVHPGDEFQILYERLYRTNDDGEDVYVRPGRILAGRYAGKTGDHTVVYFEDGDGQGAYFRPDGSSVERAFLAAPLEFRAITSRFTRSRQHPILKVTRPHPGIDYAAPKGTPIWSVAAGVVEYRARAGASGNLIRIRHQGGLTSHYAHLASFAKGLEVGDRVEQKQIIGYVGSTGLSTGPHVCFRVKKNGTYVDPMKISGPAGDPVRASRLAVFNSVRDQLLADLGGSRLSVADEAL